MNVAQVQLLHQLIQVMMQVLLLHPQQLQLVHGEVQVSGAVAVAAALVAPQLVTHVRQPGPELTRGASAAAVQPLTELFRHRRRVTHNLTSQDTFIPTALYTVQLHCKLVKCTNISSSPHLNMYFIFLHLCAVDLVVGLRSAPYDPGCLSEAQSAPDQQRVGRGGAVVVGVVELVSLEGVVVKEAI